MKNRYETNEKLYESPHCDFCILSDSDVLATSEGVAVLDNSSGDDWIWVYR